MYAASLHPRRCCPAAFAAALVSLLPFVPARAADPAVPPPAVAPSGKPETPAERDARMRWWREARFGMFIHWGIYSVPAGFYHGQPVGGIGEWIMNRGKIPVAEYAGYAGQFNPVKFDADTWVRIAKEAGMKYIVITSKHHDGFAMFHSQDPYNIYDATPFKRDPLKELAEACRKQGIRLGFYYSQAQDWHHPGGAAAGGHWDPAQDGDMDEYINRVAVPEVREILSNYGPVAVLWWDTPVGMTPDRAAKFLPLLALQPNIIMNNRLGGGIPGDTDTPEQRIPATGIPGRDWETCMTMNNTWGFKRDDNNWKTPETLIRNLVDIASKGGNYLLNVGPTSEGVIPAPSIERLATVGQWMKTNGEAIYGTTASPFAHLDWGRCTKKADGDKTTLYLHVFDWPKDGRLIVPGLRNRVLSASVLGRRGKLKTEAANDTVTVLLPDSAPYVIASVIKLEIAGPPDITPPPPVALQAAADGSVMLTASTATIHNIGESELQVEEKGNGGPNIGYWTEPRAWVSWDLRIDRPGDYGVSAEAATPDSGAKIDIAIGGGDIAPLTVTVPSTGDYAAFQRISAGRIHVPAAGSFSVLVRPQAAGWKPINLRSIILTPVAAR